MADQTRPHWIKGTVVMGDGEEVQFQLYPDSGWQQWGNRTEVLGKTVDLMDALVEATAEHLVDPEDDEPDEGDVGDNYTGPTYREDDS